MTDSVNPQHYRNPTGTQLIELIRWLPFSIGNSIKYAYRHEQKNSLIDDLNKALWYLSDFRSNPEVWFSGAKHITPEIVENVLAGVNPFERKCCLALLDTYWSVMDNDNIEKAFETASGLIESRIALFEVDSTSS